MTTVDKLKSLFILRLIKPESFADCIGNELPLGWEEVYDINVGHYFINHNTRKFFCFTY